MAELVSPDPQAYFIANEETQLSTGQPKVIFKMVYGDEYFDKWVEFVSKNIIPDYKTKEQFLEAVTKTFTADEAQKFESHFVTDINQASQQCGGKVTDTNIECLKLRSMPQDLIIGCFPSVQEGCDMFAKEITGGDDALLQMYKKNADGVWYKAGKDEDTSGQVGITEETEAGDGEKTETDVGDVEKTETETGEVENTETEVGDVENTETEAGDVEKTETEAGDVEKTETEAGDVENTETEAGDLENTGTEAGGVEETGEGVGVKEPWVTNKGVNEEKTSIDQTTSENEGENVDEKTEIDNVEGENEEKTADANEGVEEGKNVVPKKDEMRK